MYRWRPQSRRTGLRKRIVVKVREAVKPSAYVAHKGTPPASAGAGHVTMKDVCDDDGDRLVLRDVAHVRLAAKWVVPPRDAGPFIKPNASAAYDDDDDDDDFFNTQAPFHVMGSPGTVLRPVYEDIVLNCLTPCLLVTSSAVFSRQFVTQIKLHRDGS